MIYHDYQGRAVRLTHERLAHILERAEMKPIEGEISRVLHEPEHVIRSRSDESVFLYYHWQTKTLVGEKWLCVVVKYLEDDAFILTAYLTDRLKPGETVWPNP
jgi:hypothetical protein